MPNIRLATLMKSVTVYSLGCWPKISEDLTSNCKQCAMKMETKRQRVYEIQ